MPDFAADVRFAARTLRRSPGFTVTAIAAIVLGIGASTAMFSVVNKVLLEPLPYPQPDRLVQLLVSSQLGDQTAVSIPQFVIWRSWASFRYIAAYDIGAPGVNLVQSGVPETLTAVHGSADYFPMLGADALLGRTFTAEEDRPGSSHTVVISYNLWRKRFSGDTALIGTNISLDHNSYKVIGVLAPGFVPNPPADIWMALQADPATTDHVSRVHVIARLCRESCSSRHRITSPRPWKCSGHGIRLRRCSA